MTADASEWKFCESLESNLALVTPMLELLLRQLEAFRWEADDNFGIHLAVEEALVNAIRHGNREDSAKKVLIEARIDSESFWIRVTDEGPGFNPAAVPDPTRPENLLLTSGRGLLLMRSYMTSVEYNQVGNQVTMEKRRSVAS